MADMSTILKVDSQDCTLAQKIKNFRWHSEKKTLDGLLNRVKEHCISVLVLLGWGHMSAMKEINTIATSTAATMEIMAAQMDQDRKERREIDTITRTLAARVDEDRTERQQVTGITRDMASSIGILAANMDEDRRERQKLQEESKRKEIEAWLSPLEFQVRQQQIFEEFAFHHQAGQWFLERDEIKYWKEDVVKVLRCYGEPGAGKTVLSSIVVEHLVQESPETPVLCIYLEKIETMSHTRKNLLGSLLKQLVQFKESGVSPAIRDTYEKARRMGTSPSEPEMTLLLKSEIESYQRVYIVVDGLDETSPDSQDFIERRLRKLSLKRLSILTMSRPVDETAEEDIYCSICDSEFQRPCIKYYRCWDCLENSNLCFDLCVRCVAAGKSCTSDPSHTLIEEVQESYEMIIETPDHVLEHFVHSSIKSEMPEETASTDLSSRRRGVRELVWQCHRDASFFGQVISTIVYNAEGRFLLARAYLKSLKSKRNLREIKAALKNRKEDGEDMIYPLYKEDMERIVGQERGDAKLARQILALQALGTHIGDTEYDLNGEDAKQTILNVTKGLIGIDRDTSDQEKQFTVRFDHLTRREYLDEHWEEWFPEGRVYIANACMTFLSFDTFSKPSEDFAAKEKELPFISYAAQYWGDHVREAGLGATEVAAAAVKYLRDPSRVEAYIQAAWNASMQQGDRWDVWRTIHPLHLCAWFDLDHLILALVDEAHALNVQEETHGQTPLMYACRRGNVNTVRRLLALGALVNKQSHKGRTALFEALIRLKREDNSPEDIEKSLQIVKLLLDPSLRGGQLDVNIRNPKLLRRSALIYSISLKQSDIALAIIEHPRVKINLQDLEGTTALALAACNGLTDVVEAILNVPSVDKDRIDYVEHRTALILAAKYSNAEMVSLLLGRGANPALKDSRGGTALLRAVEAGNVELPHAFMDSKDPRIDLSWGDTKIIKMFKDKGLPVSIRDNFGMTSLHDACRGGNIDAMVLLLEMGADLAATDNFDRTPATVALQYGHSELLGVFQDSGTKKDVQPPQVDRTEDLPVWSLATLRRLDLIHDAICSKITPLEATEPRTQRTALHCVLLDNPKEEATENESIQIEILRELLEARDSSLDSPDKFGKTPLHLAAIYGKTEVMKLLLEHDVKLDEVDRFNLTPLVIACKNRHIAVAVSLIEAGARIDERRVYLQELLFAAIEFQNIKAVANLITAGADRMALDEEGRTADMLAEKARDVELLNILKLTKSFRWKAPTGEQKTGVIVSELEEIFEEEEQEVEEDLEGVVWGGELPVRGVNIHDVPARQIPFTPFRSGYFYLEEEVKQMLDELPVTPLKLEPNLMNADKEPPLYA
ncbi:ankyrin repeat-containing domain protein [Halenospora varia]|nr:ankyrin repeat-containing domain protein [Halenospora varia]